MGGIKKWVELKFEIGQFVYITTDEDQKLRQVVSIHLKESGVVYELQSGTISSWHYGFEISEHINVKIKTSE